MQQEEIVLFTQRVYTFERILLLEVAKKFPYCLVEKVEVLNPCISPCSAWFRFALKDLVSDELVIVCYLIENDVKDCKKVLYGLPKIVRKFING